VGASGENGLRSIQFASDFLWVYNEGMNPETLRLELNRDPFIPLRIHLVDGRTIEIRNPGLCFIARLSLYVFAARPHDALAEDVNVISLRGIVSVETLPPSAAA
jgi:hypothetical protein